jgi:hypothetical protein
VRPATVALTIDAPSRCRETYDRMARISIAPDWARYFDFAAGRFPDFLSAR